MFEGPYAGLMPFTEEQAQYFFGREAEREIISANLMASRLTLLYGPSGVGKSSVINAGVAHDLRAASARSRTRRGAPEFALVVFRSWRDDPLRGLEHAIAAEVGHAATGSRFDERLRSWSDAIDGDLLIVLDQFEEYFLYHSASDGDGTFAVEFPRAVNRADLRVSFLLSMREDSIAKLDFFKGRVPRLFENYLRIDHLDRTQARDAILKPIARYNQTLADPGDARAIEPALVEEVLSQVGAGRVAVSGAGKGRLSMASGTGADSQRVETPYLQLVLTRLWQTERAAGSHTLRAATLESLGGAGHIVSTHLDAALDALTADERDIAAAIFQFLVTPSGTKIALGVEDLAQYARRDLEQIRPLLLRLSGGENRILIPVAPPPDQPARESYQIFHDVLAAAVLEWRTRYVRTAERAAADARTEEQRLRAEREAEAANRLRRQKRTLTIAVIAAVVLLLVVAALGVTVSRQKQQFQKVAQELKTIQSSLDAIETRSRDIQTRMQASLTTADAQSAEAAQLARSATDLVRKGDNAGAMALLARAERATKQASAARGDYVQLSAALQKEQQAAAVLREKGEEIGKSLPPMSRMPDVGTQVATAPPQAAAPQEPAKAPPTAVQSAPASTGRDSAGAGARAATTPSAGDYKDSFRKGVDASNRRRWTEARDMLALAVQQNGQDTGERITISGFGNYEPYLPHYFLGVALKNLGDCAGAVRAWNTSEQQEAVKKTHLYKPLQQQRAACQP